MTNITSYSKYASCLVDVLGQNEHCEYRQRNTYYLVCNIGITIGVINNVFLIIVFFQKKYNNQIISLMLRYLYANNLLFTFLLFFDNIAELATEQNEPSSHAGDDMCFVRRSLALPWRVALKVSAGIHAYLSVLRFAHTKWPYFVAFSPKSYTLTYLVLLVIVIVSLGLNIGTLVLSFDEKRIMVALSDLIYYSLAIITVVSFNIAWMVLETNRIMRVSRQPTHTSSSACSIRKDVNVSLYQFVSWTSVLFVTTTMPMIIVILIPSSVNGESCSACIALIHAVDSSMQFMYCSCYLDHLWFYTFSAQYRTDLTLGLKRLFTSWKA